MVTEILKPIKAPPEKSMQLQGVKKALKQSNTFLKERYQYL